MPAERVLIEMLRFVQCLLLIAIIAASSSGCTNVNRVGSRTAAEPSNEDLVRAAFDRWRAGTGGPFELLADEAHWTIVGSSPVSKSYTSREQFMAEVIRPFNARMEKPLRPMLRSLYSDGDTVIVVFDAESLCVDGLPYRNTYAWFIQMEAGRWIRVTAFFDTRLFDEMWTRVAPR